MRLFLASFLLLFVELALIRWIPAHALYLTFFTNVVLLASFLGIALGCLRARGKDLFPWTPAALSVAMLAAHGVERMRALLEPRLDMGGQSAPQMIFFGTENFRADLATFPIPVELLAGVFFALVAACLYGLGQELGRRLEDEGGGPRAYGLNLAGSLAGVAAFGLAARLELTPFWWFLLVAALFEKLAAKRSPARWAGWGVVLAAALLTSVGEGAVHRAWSPYYRIDWTSPPAGDVNTNLISHQRMTPTTEPNPTYALPHLLRRDSGGAPYKDVLVIGAGSGNDVARALQWGASSVDAVEIDPAIQRIGAAEHPDRPYDDPRVRRVIGDGRRFLKTGERKYDLVVYALVDSLVLHSGYSNIRLESYLFTREAIEDAKRRLKPGGTLVLYNYFRQGWVVGRLHRTLTDAFGAPPLVITTPYQPLVTETSGGGFTLFLAGDTDRLLAAFRKNGVYRFDAKAPGSPSAPNGFRGLPRPGEPLSACALSEVRVPPGLALATDDWPFLYLRAPMIPAIVLRGMAVMLAVSLVLLAAAGRGAKWRRADPRMFFLGAGFMLLETKAVVTAALFFGGTWVVNSFVFAGVLAVLLAANLLAARLKPKSLVPWYAGLFATLAASWVATPGSAAAGVLSFAPLLFAGVVFSASYARSKEPSADFGVNAAGAMAGGLAENASMLLGFRGLAVVAAALYALSALAGRRGRA